ncbi:glutathione synthetase [Streptomyces sp. NPDC091416]|uniref:glutathione synthetase n=1 Tax=Streptomyces sp. NPDC091416 TaxID=3366003 RepID=UPI0037F64783
MALAAPVPEVAPSASRSGAAAIIAPSDAGDLYVPALERHGWNCVAVAVPGTRRMDGAGGYLRNLNHRGNLRRTAAHLSHLDVRAVLAGSPAGTVLADRLASRLHLPGNDPNTTDTRRDTGSTHAALLDAGIAAPRSITATRLADALTWAAFTQVAELLLEHPDPAHPGSPFYCCSATDIRSAWQHLQHSSGQPLTLREHLAGTRYRIHAVTGPGPDRSTDHTVTTIWAETLAASHAVWRADLLSRQGLLSRALTLYINRALRALGVRYGPSCATVTFIPDRGPALLSLRTDPYADFASEVLQQVTGHNPFHDTALLLTTGRRYEARHQPGRPHTTKVALLPRSDGALDPHLLRTVTTLPTVVATTVLHAGAPVRAGQVAGCLLLVADDSRAIDHDHQVIRAAEKLGLYGAPA